ncbi:Uncharacterised protein [Staphylococcus gallinarum]|uniref:Uncharacterized protein n=1 Tax=Staphylococcus gallinarum TaxID=1293 RepID=A0A380FIV1_STAGA|nr:Uncharacterised protein [Staphylococcus gallinarum]
MLVTKPTYGAIQQNNDSQYKSVDNIENRDTNQRDSLMRNVKYPETNNNADVTNTSDNNSQNTLNSDKATTTYQDVTEQPTNTNTTADDSKIARYAINARY